MAEDWLNPLNRIRIQNAVRAKSPKVQLTNGRVFLLNYKRYKDKVFISPEHKVSIADNELDSNLVPRGTFDIGTISDPEWLVATIHGVS
jgi:hypothetical protein